VPLIFMKPPSAIIAHGETVILPAQSQQVEHEAELVAVVGKRGRHIPADEAKNFILGYTIGNDITARDLQKIDGQWTGPKGAIPSAHSVRGSTPIRPSGAVPAG
jgi:2-keto-4-pentenoate hydratase/2-oxohepta-3-ene-1,7-dioic acid hydratase in catechol pathway